MKSFAVIFCLSLGFSALARPAPQTSSFAKQNGEDAIKQNDQFANLTPDSSCTTGENACVNSQFAQCVSGKFVLQSCGSGLICAALPLVNSAGTSITCATQSDVDSRIAATGATGGGGDDTGSASSSSSASSQPRRCLLPPPPTSSASGNSSGLQTSLCLDSSLVQTGFEKDGQQVPAQGQVASATSSNNFINFCATSNLPLTNGQQVKGGSCNAAPMGIIAATTNMPSAKFTFPQNMGTVKPNQSFTVKMAIKNLATGQFVNADDNYFSAPQSVDSSGNILGHSHIVIEQISSITDANPTDPTKFAFFKGLNDEAQNGVLSANVTGGLPVGTYRLASINSAANHQPVLVAVAQHGSLDDMVYFTVKN
ncbi:hypothetical protein EW145_g3041 [Phellinidium pouzarii]|uniref:Carbohydrate-binding module family 19 domain-containing protein n=1 Tax=Phellinidium pouzarii TaxID=167371 RepID=A0A4S4LAI6_9AGAM|nr:hypothetical protein EW145_g3041 [Phellinidium pouzarii]